MSVGKNIQKYRKQCNLTQQELADKIGISKSHMSKIEIDNKEPSFDVLLKISKVLNVLTTDLKPSLSSNSKYKEMASYFAGPGLYVVSDSDTKGSIEDLLTKDYSFSESEIIQMLLDNYNDDIFNKEYDTNKITDSQLEELKPIIREIVKLILYKYAKK